MRETTKNNLAKCIIISSLIIGLIGVGYSIRLKKNKTKHYIITTTSILADIVGNIVKDKWAVETIIPLNTDPHEATLWTGIECMIQQADLLIKNGLHLEGSLDENLQNYGTNLTIFAASDALDPTDKRHYLGYQDPHFWFDPQLVIKVVNKLTTIIIGIDPANKNFYEKQSQSYIRELQTTLDNMKQTIQSIAKEGKFVVVPHNSLGYLAKYGLDIRPIKGVSTEGDPNLRIIDDLCSSIVDSKINVIFHEKSVSDTTIDSLIEKCKKKGHHVEKKFYIQMH